MSPLKLVINWGRSWRGELGGGGEERERGEESFCILWKDLGGRVVMEKGGSSCDGEWFWFCSSFCSPWLFVCLSVCLFCFSFFGLLLSQWPFFLHFLGWMYWNFNITSEGYWEMKRLQGSMGWVFR